MRTENGNAGDGGQQHPDQPNAALPPRGITSGTVSVIQAVSAALFDNDLETDDAEDEEEEQQRQQKDHARAVDGRCHSEGAATAMDTNFHGSSTQLMADAGLEMKNIPGIDR